MSATHYVEHVDPRRRLQVAACGRPTREHHTEPTCPECLAQIAADAQYGPNETPFDSEPMGPPVPSSFGHNVATQGYRPRGYDVANESTERRR